MMMMKEMKRRSKCVAIWEREWPPHQNIQSTRAQRREKHRCLTRKKHIEEASCGMCK